MFPLFASVQALLSPYQTIQGISRNLIERVDDVAIGIEGQVDGRVAQKLAYQLRVDILFKEEAGRRMAKIMETDFRQARLPGLELEMSEQVPRGDRGTDVCCEDQTGFLPGRAFRKANTPCQMRFERLYHKRRHNYHPSGLVHLGLKHQEALGGYILKRSGDLQIAVLHV